jgi:hypothetical protein
MFGTHAAFLTPGQDCVRSHPSASSRSIADRHSIKLSVDLLCTYKQINELFNAKRKQWKIIMEYRKEAGEPVLMPAKLHYDLDRVMPKAEKVESKYDSHPVRCHRLGVSVMNALLNYTQCDGRFLSRDNIRKIEEALGDPTNYALCQQKYNLEYFNKNEKAFIGIVKGNIVTDEQVLLAVKVSNNIQCERNKVLGRLRECLPGDRYTRIVKLIKRPISMMYKRNLLPPRAVAASPEGQPPLLEAEHEAPQKALPGAGGHHAQHAGTCGEPPVDLSHIVMSVHDSCALSTLAAHRSTACNPVGDASFEVNIIASHTTDSSSSSPQSLDSRHTALRTPVLKEDGSPDMRYKCNRKP